MKNKMETRWLSIVAWAVALILIVALAANAFASHKALEIHVVGTYGTNAGPLDTLYLTLDPKGNYTYGKSLDRRHEGTYTVDGRVITMTGNAGTFSAVYMDDTVYFYQPDGGMTVHSRVSDSVVIVGD